MTPSNQNAPLYTSVFFLLCLSQVLFAASFSMMLPELPDYLRSIGGEDYIGLIIGLFTLMAGLSRPFSGKLTDTIGRMPVQIFGTLVCVFASLLYPFATTVFGFLLLRFFHGFSTGFKPTATTAYLADIVPFDRRGEAMGILGVSMNVGASIAPPVGSSITNAYSLNAMFYTSSAVALISVVILLGMKETLQQKQKFSLKHLTISKHDVYDKSALLPAALALLTYMGLGILLTIGPDQSVHYGMTNKGLFLGAFTASSILSRLVAGRVSDRYGRVPVLRFSVVFLAVSMASFYFVTDAFTFILMTGILGFAIGISSPTLFAWVVDRCKDEHRGRALATIYIALELSIGGAALLSDYLYGSNPENFGYTFLIFAALTITGLFLLINAKDTIVPKR